MTRFIVVTPNVESDIAVGIEQGARYVLISGDGRRAVLNDPDDVDFVGFLTAPPSGLDSADIRESADVIVEGDGGVHGNFYLGRRPWTLTGLIDPTERSAGDIGLNPAAIVNKRIDKLKRATRALRTDSTLGWTPQGGVPVQIGARLTNLRVTERWPKAFQLAMVSADPRIMASILTDAAAAGDVDITARNDGNTPAAWTLTLRNAWTDPTVENQGTGGVLDLTLSMAATDTLVIDSRARTIEKNGVNAYSALNFPASEWWELIPGDNVLHATGKGTGGTWGITWRSAWE